MVRSRDELYTDVRLNDTLCERYQSHMGRYQRDVLKRHDKVLTGSSDIGMWQRLVREDNSNFIHRECQLRDSNPSHYVWYTRP